MSVVYARHECVLGMFHVQYVEWEPFCRLCERESGSVAERMEGWSESPTCSNEFSQVKLCRDEANSSSSDSP